MKLIKALFFLGLLYQVTSWCLRTTLSQKFTIQEVDWAPNNAFFVTANRGDETVRIYNASSYEVIKVHTEGQEPRSVKISKDSRYVAIGYANSRLTVLETTAWSVFMGFNTDQDQIAQVDFTFDNLSVLTCGKFERIRTYDLGLSATQSAAQNVNYKFTGINNGDIVACRCGPNGEIAFAQASRKLNVLTLPATTLTSLPDTSSGVIELDFRPGTEGIIGYITRDNVFKWNSTANITFPSGSASDPLLTALNYGKTKFMALGFGKSVLIYERVGNFLVANFPDSKNTISSVKLSFDEKFLLTGDISGQIRVYSTVCGMYGCESGQYNESNLCIKCSEAIPFCITCKSSAACVNCMLGYFRSGSTCAACHSVLDSCLSCQDSTQCNKCLDGYYLDGSTKKCVRCSQTGCIECNGSSVCTKCFKNDYYLNSSSNSCRKCNDSIPNCVRCHDLNTCVDCQIGFYEDPTTFKCVQCLGNCLACQSSTNCTECKVGYWASSGSCVRCTVPGCISCNQTGVCVDCKQGTFLAALSVCTACNIPCSTCSVLPTNCTGCNLGYYLDAPNFSCVKCIQNCKICNESLKCLSCFPGFRVDGTTFTCRACSNYYGNCSECSQTVCLRCREGFYIDVGAGSVCKSCVSAIPMCMSCGNESTCFSCITSYYPTGLTGVNSCASCGRGCQQCTSATNCTNCFTTFFKNTSLMCEPCKNNCFECTTDIACISCAVGYYLDLGVCKACQTIMLYCSVCSSASVCVTCMPGAYLDDADNKCKLCALASCLTCTKTACFSCEMGQYLDTAASPNLCKSCPQQCQQCTSAIVCSSCIDGYYFDLVDKKCKSCAIAFPHCTLCNKTACLQCDRGAQLNITNDNACEPCSSHIPNCKSCFWDNSLNTPVVKCTICNYGFGLAVNNLSCPACNLIGGCVECKSASLCTKCEVGFYLKNDNTCGWCMASCLTCGNASSCLSCQDGYVNDTTSCVLCESKINGCSKCIAGTVTTFNCTYCQLGYYLNMADSQCYICHSNITGCHTCNDSLTCTACLDKYFLDTTGGSNSCKKCVSALFGCQICNSSLVCLSCEDSYYLDVTSLKCFFCSSNIPGCMHCNNNTVCSQCESGYFLSPGNVCNLCQGVISGCIYCNSATYCFQCRTGYYLNPADNKCYQCSQTGCQVCSSNSPNTCVTCNSNYYLVGSTCNTCRSRVYNCEQCSASHCLECDVGYYLLSPTVCATCSSNINGCSRCADAATCLECMSSYFLNSTHCHSCNQAILGCQNCLNPTTCISCQTNFYLNSTTAKCQPCTDITGCLLCKNQSVCLMCQQKYFISANQCSKCSQVLNGCFSCVTEHVCVQCQTGYALDPVSYKCSVNTVEAKQAVEGLKLVTYYVSKNMLKHVLLARGTTFKKSDSINITQNGLTQMFVEDYTGKEVQLTVLSYEYGTSGNSLIFYTDNPLQSEMDEKSKQMSFRRLEAASQSLESIFESNSSRILSVELNLKVMVKMSQQIYRQILPELDYSGSVTVGYSLNNPEFMNSYMTVETGNRYLAYEIIGIVAICLFLVNYLVKFLISMPKSRNRSTLLPHIIALKSCCLILYPSHFEYISFCKGFMIVDFPWLNSLLAHSVTDLSDTVQVPFGLFFQNMSIAGTYLVGLSVYAALVLSVRAYFYVTKRQGSEYGRSDDQESEMEDSQKKQKEFKIQTLQSAMGINYDNDESTGNKQVLAEKNWLELLWNIFTFSMVYYSCVSVQGAFGNYSQILTLNGVFYIMGMLMFIYVTTETFYAFYRNFKNVNKVRIYLKAFLLSLAHYNPIYIVSVCIIIDILLTVVQFFTLNRQNKFSKFFALTHILSSIMIGLMIFVSGSLVSLVTTAVSLVICFGFEVYIHVREYQNANKNVNDEDFRIDQDSNKPVDDEEPFDWANHVWDLNKKSHNLGSGKNIHMYATTQAFGKSDGFEMENVDMQPQADNRPDTKTDNRPETNLSTVKPGGRRSKQKKAHQLMNSNTIQVVPNQREDPREKLWGKIMADKFSSEDMDSNSS